MQRFTIPPLLAEARQWKAEQEREARAAAERARAEEFARRQAGLFLFYAQFGIEGPHAICEPSWKVGMSDEGPYPYLPYGPFAIFGTGEDTVLLCGRCRVCGDPTGALSGELIAHWERTGGPEDAAPGELMQSKRVFDRVKVLAVLADADAQLQDRPHYCPAHTHLRDAEESED
jgi:hypothetical protein